MGCYRHGEPVWALVEGYPWWPAKIVNREDLLGAKGSELQVGEDEVLVQFFNDNNRYSVRSRRYICSFLGNTNAKINGSFFGKVYEDNLREAIKQATDYASQNGWSRKRKHGNSTREVERDVQRNSNSQQKRENNGLQDDPAGEGDGSSKKRKKDNLVQYVQWQSSPSPDIRICSECSPDLATSHIGVRIAVHGNKDEKGEYVVSFKPLNHSAEAPVKWTLRVTVDGVGGTVSLEKGALPDVGGAGPPTAVVKL